MREENVVSDPGQCLIVIWKVVRGKVWRDAARSDGVSAFRNRDGDRFLATVASGSFARICAAPTEVFKWARWMLVEREGWITIVVAKCAECPEEFTLDAPIGTREFQDLVEYGQSFAKQIVKGWDLRADGKYRCPTHA